MLSRPVVAICNIDDIFKNSLAHLHIVRNVFFFKVTTSFRVFAPTKMRDGYVTWDASRMIDNH